jgi:uncharacterized protein (DUF2267 family)
VAQEKIVPDTVIDPVEATQDVLLVVASYIGVGEMEKVMHSLPQDMQPLFPALSAATP